MKRIVCIVLCVISLLINIACSNGNEPKNFTIDNSYFSKPTYTKKVLTSVGVNGNDQNSTRYKIVITSKAYVPITSFDATIFIYSNDNELLCAFEETMEKNYNAEENIVFSYIVDQNIYDDIGEVFISWKAQSSENPNQKTINTTKQIQSIEVDTHNLTLLVNETYNISYSFYPTDANENVIIKSDDNTIIEIEGKALKAKKIGATQITLYTNSKNNISQTINVEVIKHIDATEFTSNYETKLKKAILNVYCVAYNSSSKKYNTTGKGVIVKSEIDNDKYFFVTSKSIFNNSSLYKYGEWYVKDYLGVKYKITEMHIHNNADLAIGEFSSTTNYYIASIYKSIVHKGDYVFSLFSTPNCSRILETTYSSSFLNTFYHEVDSNQQFNGEPLFNANGEIIGLNNSFYNGKAVAISSIEIRELFDAIFNKTNNSGPKDVFGDLG